LLVSTQYAKLQNFTDGIKGDMNRVLKEKDELSKKLQEWETRALAKPKQQSNHSADGILYQLGL